MLFLVNSNPRLDLKRNRIIRFCVFLLIALFPIRGFSGSYVAMSLQGDAIGLARVQSELEGEGHSISVLVDRTLKFDNDNLYVELYHPATNSAQVRVLNRDVVIPLPAEMTADQLMETLQKVRAARVLGANQIVVAPAVPLEKVVVHSPLSADLSLEELLAVAGADEVRESGVPSLRPVREVRPRKNRVTQAGFLIGSTQPDALGDQVATMLGVAPTSFEELRSHPEALIGRKIYWFSASVPPVHENYFLTLAQIRLLEASGAAVHLVTPYLPYARSDKPEFSVGVAAQGRLAADLIEAVGTQGVTVVRAHAPQSLGFFKIHADELSGRSMVIDYLKSQSVECVISPDAGFQKEATLYQQELFRAHGSAVPVCLVVMNKQRNAEGATVLGGTGLEQIAGKKVVIIDDEVSTGGTLSQVAEAIHRYSPASIFALVTHLAGSGQKVLNSPYVEKLIVTDTLPTRVAHAKLEILSLAAELKSAILKEETNR
jgi:ribose-phosphate pyrophosphokinase